MDLRQPPRTPERAPVDRTVRGLLILVIALLMALIVWSLLRSFDRSGNVADAERDREVAARLLAAGALDEAAVLYERYLERSAVASDRHARIAFSLGSDYLEAGRYEEALRWLYEAESLGVGDLGDELASRIVHCLDRLGRHHAAQAALESRVELDAVGTERSPEDPVVARVGPTEIHRSEVLRVLDSVPAEIAAGFTGPEGREELLRKYVADELLWRKAVKMEYDRDPEVERQLTELLKQLAVMRFVEQEILASIEVDESDLRNFFAAHRDRYRQASDSQEESPGPEFDQVRQLVERDYRRVKMESAYNELVDTELSTQDVEMYPERMTDGG